MRIVLLVFCFLFLPITLLAQISISSSDVQSWYSIGKAVRYVYNDSVKFNFNIGIAAATSQSWTLPSVKMSDSISQVNLPPSITPYASRFPRATHAQRVINTSAGNTTTIYTFTRIATDSLIDLGSATRSQASGRDTTYFDIYYQLESLLPATYGMSVSRRDSTFKGFGAYSIHRTNDVFDAFGSITLPIGTYQALRHKEMTFNENHFPGLPTNTDSSVSFTWISREGVFLNVGPVSANPGNGSIPVQSVSYSYVTAATGIARGETSLPDNLVLQQNYPNPFNPSTTISYQLPAFSAVTLRVYDVLGKEVATLVEGVQQAGSHTVVFDGSSLRSGVYFYRIQAGSFQATRKLMLIK